MKKINNRKLRLSVQLFFLVVVIIAATNHLLKEQGINFQWVSESVFHYICPICGVTSIYQLFFTSSLWIVRFSSILAIVIGIAIILSFIFGPVICGYICPFGTIQDLLSRIGKKLLGKKFNRYISKKVDNKLKYLRYVILIITILLTSMSSIIILELINPYHGFLSIIKGEISIIAISIFIIIVIASIFIHRPWCKYLCPYGALLGLSNKIKVFRVVRKKKTCISCKKCTNVCPMNIDVHEKEEVRDLRCISCFECTNKLVCPKEKTIMCSHKEIENI